MNLFDSLRAKASQKESTEAEQNPECKDSLQTAAVAMSIVDAGIERNDLAEISERLGDLRITEDGQAQYVFEAESMGVQLLTISFGIIFTIIFCVLLFVGLNAAILSNLFEMLASGIIIGSVTALVVNISVITIAIRSLRYKARYSRYYSQLKYHRIEAVDNISEITGYRKTLVIKDLKKAVQKKYIPEGHFGRNYFLFMVSDEIYDGYKQKPAVYDHYFLEKIEGRERMRGHNADTQRILETGKSYIEKIHDSNDLIKDKEVSEKLTQMEMTVSMIFKEVDLHPEQAQKLGLFLNYYLPTTDKLLKNYISIDEKGVDSKRLSKTLRELSKSLDTINTAFGRILELLYIEQESDVLSDIEAMEAMMSSEGLVEPE